METENCKEVYDSTEDKVEVTPNGIWPIATAGLVKHQGERVLPIVRILMCPAIVTVYRTEFPEGVILCNDYPPPNNMKTYLFRTVLGTGSSEEVILTNNAGWPWCNKVLFWEKE
jgi:hypothetical protein